MTVLLVIIYVSFISLGLPDSLLGSTWPQMHLDFGAPLSMAGLISMIIAGGTIVSSLCSDRLIRRIGTGVITAASVGMTAVALLGMSRAGSLGAMCLWAVPLGLGAGAVDAALNNFVALHYRAAHMSWLHCFWGLGASAGPLIISRYLADGGNWGGGWRAIGIIQLALVAVLVASLPLWRRAPRPEAQAPGEKAPALGMGRLLRLPGAGATLLACFCYCAVETTVGLWGSTFLVTVRHVAAQTAAGWISLYYIGITLGRAASGFLALRLKAIAMLRLGCALIAAGALLLALPGAGWHLLGGLFLIGLGCAPIYPTILHETPNSFGKAHSQAIMGVQMASAYVGTTAMPPLFGLLGGWLGYSLLPWYVLALLVLMAAMVQVLYTQIGRARRAN